MYRVCTKSELIDGFHALGVKASMALEAHCALRAFALLENGAQTVIEAMMEAVSPEGAIVMPSFRLSPNLALDDEDRSMGLTMKIRILDADEPRTGLGIVADTFRARDDVVTGDGIFRVSAWGKDAGEHARGLGKLIDENGKALMLGVDIYRLSSMHYVEDALPEAIKARFAPPEAARRRYPEDQWLIEAWAPEAKPWYAIERRARDAGFIREKRICGAQCMLMDVKGVTGLYRRALEMEPYALYGLTENE